MNELALSLLGLLIAVVGAAWLLVDKFVLKSHLYSVAPGEVISRSDFAVIERDLSELKKVIIFADRIEEPSDLLLDAIKDNITQGVEYNFYVSDDNYEDAIGDPLRYFHHVEAMQNNLQLGEKTRLTKVFKVGHSRSGKPYVFYVTGEGEDRKVVCFKGMDAGKGISDKYVQLQPDEAFDFYNLLARSHEQLLLATDPQEFSTSVANIGLDDRKKRTVFQDESSEKNTVVRARFGSGR